MQLPLLDAPHFGRGYWHFYHEHIEFTVNISIIIFIQQELQLEYRGILAVNCKPLFSGFLCLLPRTFIREFLPPDPFWKLLYPHQLFSSHRTLHRTLSPPLPAITSILSWSVSFHSSRSSSTSIWQTWVMPSTQAASSSWIWWIYSFHHRRIFTDSDILRYSQWVQLQSAISVMLTVD